MYCNNCGAKLSKNDTICPYCGYSSPEKEESAYMKHLNDLMKDTKDLEDVPATEYKSEIKQQSRRALKVFLIVAAVFLVPTGIFSAYRIYDSYRTHQEYLEESAFEKKYLSTLNDLYQNAGLEETYNYLISLSDKKGYSAVFHWKHYPFLSYYDDYLFIQDVMQDFKTEQPSESDLTSAFYHAMELTREVPASRDYHKLTAEEKARFQLWQNSCDTFLQTVFHLTAEDADALYPSLCSYHAIMYSECKKYVHSQMDGGVL